MKLIIAGSRTATDYQDLLDAIKYFGLAQDITEIVSGTAKGADTLGERYAKENKIKLTRMPADWDTYGKSAGPIRNGKMVEYSEGLLALWDKKSKGTKNCVELAEESNLRVYVYKI